MKNKILIVSPTPSHPQNAGNRSRIFQFVNILKTFGFEIHFLYFNMESNAKHVTTQADNKAMREAWDKFYFVPNTNPAVIRQLKKNIAMAKQGETNELKNNLSFPKNELAPFHAIRNYFSIALIGFVNQINHIIVEIDAWIGILGRKLLKVDPRVYIFLRKTFIGNKQSLLNKNPVRSLDDEETDQLQIPDINKTALTESFEKEDDKQEENKIEESISIERIENVGINKNFKKEENQNDRNSENLVYKIDDWYNEGLDSIASFLHKKYNYDIVLAEYVFMSRVLLNFPETVLKVIDTHDIFTNRNLNYKKMGFQDSFFSTSRSEETKGFNRADVLIAIQKKEEAIIKNMTKTQQVFTIGHKVEIYSAKMRNTARYQILYLGAGNISNIDGINYFIEYILPKLVAKIENVKLVLSGNICNHIVDAPNIEKLGEVKNIEDAYKEADIVINPGRVGTGLKIKNIEALGFGLPLVCTSQAAEGMDCLNNEFMVADDLESFTAAILNLFLNEESYNTQAKRAIDFAENYNENIFTNVKSIFIDQPKLHKIDKTEKT